jgi:ribosome-associated translation inhibitor RaiA
MLASPHDQSQRKQCRNSVAGLNDFKSRKGTPMKFSITYKNVEAHTSVEKMIAPHIVKLEKLLKSYAPDLVQLHGAIAKQARKEEYRFTLNLALPTGTLHCIGEGDDVGASVKTAFAELEGQLKRHKALVRHDYEWKRKRPRPEPLQ